MLKAKKANKTYVIEESQKERYIKDGFEIVKNGKVIASRKITLESRVKELEKENAKLKAELKAEKK